MQPTQRPRARRPICRSVRQALAALAIALALAPPTLIGQGGAAPAAGTWTREVLTDSFRVIHRAIDRDIAAEPPEETPFRTATIRLVRRVLAEAGPRAQADALNAAVEIANRLDTRALLLREVSALCYSLDLPDGADADITPLLFTFGNIEKARGDMQAAQMWFDSTVALRHGPHTPLFVSAAAKLNGCIDRDEGRPHEALRHLRFAKTVLDTLDVEPSESLHLDGVLASAIAKAGGDTAEALALSTAAYDRLAADADVRDAWTYAYLVYLCHAQVLAAAGQPERGLRVMREALALTRARGDRSSSGYIHFNLARRYIELARLPEAEAAAREALGIFEVLEHHGHLAQAHSLLEEIYERDDATLRLSLRHAREVRHLERVASEEARAEGMLALQNDHRRAAAEQKALLAERAAEASELARAKVAAQRTSLITGLLLICGILAFVAHRLRGRRRDNDTLEALVAERTAELATRTGELESRTRRLEASNQELERFAFIASHDLKTPLRNVTSFLGLIERRMPEAARPAIGEYVDMARGYARKMHALVTDVLEFSRLNDDLEGMSKIVDVRELCLAVAAERTTDRPGASVEVVGAATVVAPPVFLRQVVGNLVDNGLKYNESASPRVTVSVATESEELVLRVRDNGIGIAEEYHGYVFELFRRLHTEDAYAGTGLGLGTCAKIVERLGGTISLESAVGAGSTFTVRLPVSGPVTPRSARPPAPAAALAAPLR